MKNGLRESGLLITIAIFLAMGTYIFHPHRPDWQTSQLSEGGVSIGFVENSFESVLWIDARKDEEYAEGHIPNAILLNEYYWDEGFERLMLTWDPTQVIVVYCDGGSCQASKAVMNRLKSELGSENIYFLIGGYPEWKNHYN